MSSIVHNQRRAYLAQATDAARVLGARLRSVSPAEQAALLAYAAHEARCPVDISLLTEQQTDGREAAFVLDDELAPGDTRWSWQIGSGCQFIITILPKEHTHE